MPSQFLFFFLPCLTVASAASAVDRIQTLPGCQPKCGNVKIPYPFGVGKNCSLAPWADVNCNTTFTPPKPFIAEVEVAEILATEVRIKNSIATTCFDPSGRQIRQTFSWINLTGTPYTFSSTKNKLTAIGCDTIVLASFDDNAYSSGCISLCNKKKDVREGSCSGIGCCQSSIPKGLKNFLALGSSINNNTKTTSFEKCSTTFLVEEDKYKFKLSDITNTSSLEDVPIVVNFAIGNQTCRAAKQNPSTLACKDYSHCYDSVDGSGYLCTCNNGYEGNPYLDRGCQDVNECDQNPCEGICTNTQGSYRCSCEDGFYGDGTKEGTGCIKKDKELPVLQLTLGLGLGFLFLLVGGPCLYLSIQNRKNIKLKEMFFQKNGGLLLNQQISSREGGVESTKVFTAEELKLATNNYDRNRIVGQGGSGTVYKGSLPDLTIVAIKKSKVINECQLGQFINELVILTQINHRNVVKLIGCCLETEVPLLVYEFVSNGTLFHHLHKTIGAISITWQDRLRIAAETAGALAYLHSAATIPIIHRDVKSANILLDANFTAKVADFGASRLNPLDETQISTLVQGTMGYLDPEYFHSSQITEKSDVYSFGVVLAELLTGAIPLSFVRSENQRNLATYFVQSLKESRLFQILEVGIVNEGKTEQVLAVAELAKRCLHQVGEERPSMKEVAAELEALRGFQKHTWIKQRNEEKMSSSDEGVDLYASPSTSLYDTPSASSFALYSGEKEMGWPTLKVAR